MRRRSAIGLLVIACAACSSNSPAPATKAPTPVVADDGVSCLVADARGGTTRVPWNDPTKMKSLEGIEPHGSAKVAIQWPTEDQVLPEGSGLVRYTIEGFSTGMDEKADFQRCRLVLDNEGLAWDVGGTTTLEALNGGKPVAEGSHLLTIFPVRRSGISLKNDGACAQVRFHVKTKKGKLPAGDTEQIIWNLPQGPYDAAKGEAHNIVCDFYIRATRMATDRLMKDNNVVVTIVDPAGKRETLKGTDWAPLIVLRDRPPGTYKITLAFEERDDGDPVDVPFGETTHEITIK